MTTIKNSKCKLDQKFLTHKAPAGYVI